ncbi:hypothetical protein QM797_08790 [Rhodococcus sp. IEGM 1381]|uniref:hypothetical protein n=1 Tax=Rhodococcus sp. IEGM 1381 TaxID=3047085 RepID=UPI0024B63C68|nr:hypothetical protein [Rhodococcus sp. IEGM 1381]MDI9894820.1 hypothetical protein [Rhodococcus sp. IEGM 1381]
MGLAVLVSLAIGRSDGSGLDGAAATVDGYQLAFTVGTAILVVAAVTSFVVPRGASRA